MSKRIRDARHPAGGVQLIKLGSYMAARLKEKNGAAGLDKYHAAGAIPFFADYVRLYKSDSKIPKSLRFTPEFEKRIARWDADWSRTWNDYTRRLTDRAGHGLRRGRRASAEGVRGRGGLPRLHGRHPADTAGRVVALKSAKLGVDLYPHSDELLFNWAYFIILTELSPEGRAALKAVAGEYERPLVYFRRAFEVEPRRRDARQNFSRHRRRAGSRARSDDAGSSSSARASSFIRRTRCASCSATSSRARADGRGGESSARLNIDPGLARVSADEYVARGGGRTEEELSNAEAR